MERSDEAPGRRDPDAPFENLHASECLARLRSGADSAAEGESGPLLLDVRTEPEHRSHRIPGATLVPLHDLPRRAGELDATRPTLVYCEHGVRSIRACLYLKSLGFEDLINLRGGIVTWTGSLEGDSIDQGGGDPSC